MGGCESQWQPVRSGVPQRSVLGPLLFIIYINDIDGGVVSSVLKFADDAKIYRAVRSHEDIEQLQRDLSNMFLLIIGELYCLDQCETWDSS